MSGPSGGNNRPNIIGMGINGIPMAYQPMQPGIVNMGGGQPMQSHPLNMMNPINPIFQMHMHGNFYI